MATPIRGAQASVSAEAETVAAAAGCDRGRRTRHQPWRGLSAKRLLSGHGCFARSAAQTDRGLRQRLQV